MVVLQVAKAMVCAPTSSLSSRSNGEDVRTFGTVLVLALVVGGCPLRCSSADVLPTGCDGSS